MHRLDARAHPAQPAADVQQARRVDGGHHVGAGRHDVGALVREHRQQGIGVLDGEGAAEAAALGGLRQHQQFEPAHVREQPLGPVADARDPLRVARRVQGDTPRVRRGDVLHDEPANEELGEIEEPAAERFRGVGQPLVPRRARDARQQLAHPAHARGRRRDDCVDAVVPAHQAHEPPREPQRIVPVPAADVHLPATDLFGRKHGLVPEPLEQRAPPRSPSPGTGCRPRR